MDLKQKIAVISKKLKDTRGKQGLRTVAKQMKVSPATLSRVENGHVPDLETLSKICEWLGLGADFVLSNPSAIVTKEPLLKVHFRKKKTLPPEAVSALAQLILAAQQSLDDGGESK